MVISKKKQLALHEKRKNQITKAAMKLFDQKGYTNTTIQDISEEAEISKGLIYRYFESKEDILSSLVEALNSCIDECSAVESGRGAIKLFTMRLLSYPYYEDYVPPYRVLFTAMLRGETNINKLSREGAAFPVDDNFGRDYFGALFARGQEQGEFKEGDPVMFGDIYWKYLLGSLSVMARAEKKEFNPDVDAVLSLFENHSQAGSTQTLDVDTSTDKADDR
ncbi:MAG: TetR/AcrR family transcriptional regulator [Synergistaceae bacterium]|nr:TetR/AcrR family transcriptional regulator [Synergistaceae bacterium]